MLICYAKLLNINCDLVQCQDAKKIDGKEVKGLTAYKVQLKNKTKTMENLALAMMGGWRIKGSSKTTTLVL